MNRRLTCLSMSVLAAAAFAVGASSTVFAQLPASYDLRDYGWTTSVKSQTGGTCWAHGSMAAVEGNLLRTGRWANYVAQGIETAAKPNLAEYHLDWWNGFNWHNNDDTDPPGSSHNDGNGLDVHQGGDYRVTTAYMSRGDGAVSSDLDSGWYSNTPDRFDPEYRVYYARDVNWYTVGDGSGGIDQGRMDLVKQTIMDHGVVGTCMFYGGGFYSGGKHYQPLSDTRDPNHSIAIVGWDDSITFSGAPGDGAWLCKNSWGSTWNGDGHFWISYYDKHAGRHPQMGAVSYQNVELNEFTHVYSHDLHGWRDTLTGVSQAFNAFSATGDDPLTSVSFYTAADNVDYTLTVYDIFEAGALSGELASLSGTIDITGYHTVDLPSALDLAAGDDFYIALELSDGGHPIDRTSTVPVLLDKPDRVDDGSIVSDAEPGQSYYWDTSSSSWLDLFELALYGEDVGRDVTGSANFTIKGFAGEMLQSVPEPSGLVLMVTCCGTLLMLVRRRRR